MSSRPCLLLLFMMVPYCHSKNIEGSVEVEGSSHGEVTLGGQITAEDNKIISRSGGVDAEWQGTVQGKRFLKTKDNMDGDHGTAGVRVLNAGGRGSAGNFKEGVGLNIVEKENGAQSELDTLKQFAVDARKDFDLSNFDTLYKKYGGQ